jgi:urea transport system substrate-binding protein
MMAQDRDHPGVVKEKRAVDSPMVLSYDGVYLWKAAVEKAGTFDVDKVRDAGVRRHQL